MGRDKIAQEKKCPKCGEIKEIREFIVFKKGKTNKAGMSIRSYKTHCRRCRKIATSKRWRMRNKQRVKDYNQLYWEEKSLYNKMNRDFIENQIKDKDKEKETKK